MGEMMEVEKKQKIFEAAKDLFEKFGFKKTTVDEIAARAGISKRTLYEMFDSKEKILSELVIQEALYTRRTVRIRLKTIDDPLDKLVSFTRMARDYFEGNPFLGKVLNDEAGLYAPFLKEEIKTIEEAIEEFFYSILMEGTQKGVFRKMDERASASCIFILFRSFTYAKTLKPGRTWVQFIQSAILKENQ